VYNKALQEKTQGWCERQERIGDEQTFSMLTAKYGHREIEYSYQISK
jgi:putative transposase